MPEYGEPLTEREKDILRLVATGVTNREVAYRLGISVNTVKVHLRNVFAKLGAESRTEATMVAVQEGWIRVGSAGEALADESALLAPPVVPEPPLPWLKRVAIVAALLLVVAGVAVTWPRSRPQAGNGSAPPPPPPERTTSSVPIVESPWQERASMLTRRAYLALASVEGHIVAIAGQTPEGVTGAVEVYDPEEDVWTRVSSKPTSVTYVSAAAIGTNVYVPGGCDAEGSPMQVVEVYDVLADSWREVSPLPEPLYAYAIAALGQRLYLFGGWNGERYVAAVYVYDPQTDTWTESTPMDAERGFAAAASLGDRLYIVGGYDGERELTTCAVYDPEAGTWETCARLAVGRGGLGLVSLGGHLYAIGGGGWTSYLGFNERYDPANDIWGTIETPLIGEWRSPGVVAVETTIYAIGGWSNDYLSMNQVYDALPFRIFIPVSHQ